MHEVNLKTKTYDLNFIFDAKADSLNKKVSAQIGFAPNYTLGIKNYVNRMHTSNLVYKEVLSSFYKINIPTAKFNLTAFVTHNGVVRKYQYLSKNDYQIKVDLTEFKGQFILLN